MGICLLSHVGIQGSKVMQSHTMIGLAASRRRKIIYLLACTRCFPTALIPLAHRPLAEILPVCVEAQVAVLRGLEGLLCFGQRLALRAGLLPQLLCRCSYVSLLL